MEINHKVSARKRRVKRLKGLIVLALLLLLAFPLVCCVLLLRQMSDLNRRVDELSARLAGMEELVLQEREFASAFPEEVLPEYDGTSNGTSNGSVLDEGCSQAGKDDGLLDGLDEDQFQVDGFQADDFPMDGLDDVVGDWFDEGAFAVGDTGEDMLCRKVYLTFDDGPSVYTEKILDILAKYDVKATFFVVGKEDERSQEAIKRIVEEGHTLGMHSYSHKYAEIYKSKESFVADLDKLRNYLYDLTGVKCQYYRFPGGSSNKVSTVNIRDMADYLENQGISFYDWNIASGDAGPTLLSAETLTNNCTRGLEKLDSAIILLHDSGSRPTTVEALPAIIEKIMGMDDTELLPITEDTEPVQHIKR